MFIHVAVFIRISFFSAFLKIHPLTDIWIFLYFLATVNKSAINKKIKITMGLYTLVNFM